MSFLLTLGISGFFLSIILGYFMWNNHKQGKIDEERFGDKERIFDYNQFQKYNGKDSPIVFVGVKGVAFDVTDSRMDSF